MSPDFTALRAAGRSMPMTRPVLLAFLLLCLSGWSWEANSALAAATAGAPGRRDSERCRAHANLDACYDAIRWSPRDPDLLVALGDTLVRANRPAEALRAYRRAAILAPGNHGIAAKISAAEGKKPPGRATGSASVANAGVREVPIKRPSNTDPVAQSH